MGGVAWKATLRSGVTGRLEGDFYGVEGRLKGDTTSSFGAAVDAGEELHGKVDADAHRGHDRCPLGPFVRRLCTTVKTEYISERGRSGVQRSLKDVWKSVNPPSRSGLFISIFTVWSIPFLR